MLSLGLSDVARLTSLDISNNVAVTQHGLQVLCALAFGVHPSSNHLQLVSTEL